MAEIAVPERSVGKWARNAASKTPLMSWAAVAILLLGVLVPDISATYVILGLGALLAGLAMVLKMRSTGSGAAVGAKFASFIEHDERPVFVVDASGAVLQRNPAARKAYGDVGGASLEKTLQSVCNHANAVIFRLQAKASRLHAAREDVVTRSGRYMISVHRIAEDRFSWCIEESTDRAAPMRAADKISLPMMMVGNSGTILFMNDAMRRLVGGRVKALQKVFVDVPTVSGSVTTVSTADGPMKVRVIIISGTAGRVEYFLAPFEDEESATTSLDALEEFPVALLKISVDGVVQEANKLARDLTKLKNEDGQRLSDLLDGLGRPISEWLAEAAEGRSLHKPEVLKAKCSEHETYLQITLGRVIHDGEISLLAMLTDATELKSLEAQFVQSQKMQAIGQLAGGVAHDFNNLLTAISGHCDLLMLRHDPGDPEYGDLEQINQNANRAASLVGQLLAFSRKQNLQLEILDMRDTLADLTHLLNRLVGAQISLSLTHDPQLMSVRADRRQLEQVIMNLVVNARDAMDGRGEISIETRNMKLQSDLSRDRAVVPRGEYVLVKVSDSGHGIPADKMTKIFEPFFTTKRTGEGTGLGLSTAYGIIKQSGGFIFADSEVGKGTTFTIFFPTSEQPIELPAPEPAREVMLDPGLVEGVVLLVEDEAPVRAFASRALKLRGYNVLEAENAEEALELLSDDELNVDVVVTDVVMPGMDGPTWVKEARKTRPDMRVVFVSGYAEDSFAENQALLPNTVFLPKPFSLSDLTATVQAQMAQEAA